MSKKVEQLKKLFTDTLEKGGKAKEYRTRLRAALGICEQRDGDPKLKADLDVLKNISFGEIAHSFLGKNFGASDVSEAFQNAPQVSRLLEADGGTVVPSHFAKISGFTDTVAGLVDALALEGYQAPEFVGDKLVQTMDRKVNGGYLIGIMNDGRLGEDLLDNEPAPSVGLKQTKVHLPESKRYANVIELHEDVFTYDLTGQVQEQAKNSGFAVARSKELRIADTVLGITNSYQRDGVSANTYLTSAGTVPCDYINSATGELDDWTDVDAAIQVMEANTDPGTGFEITVGLPQLLVMPQRRQKTVNILAAEWTRQLTASGNIATQTPGNAIPQVELIVPSRIWYNRLIAAGVSTTNAPARWHMGQFKKAFGYIQIHPFATTSLTLSASEQRRDVAAIFYTREKGVPFTLEPRYAFQGTKE